jgi:hypothetical protein
MKRSVVKVVYQAGPLPWHVQASDNQYPSMSFKSKEKSLHYARQVAKSANGVLKIQDLDGKFNNEHSYGPTTPAGRKKQLAKA